MSVRLCNRGFAEGFIEGLARPRSWHGCRVLDWEKAAEICKSQDQEVYAGLAEDWDYTCGLIYDGKNFVKGVYEPYIKSIWATPVIVIGGKFGEPQECWKPADDNDGVHMPEWWCKQ